MNASLILECSAARLIGAIIMTAGDEDLFCGMLPFVWGEELTCKLSMHIFNLFVHGRLFNCSACGQYCDSVVTLEIHMRNAHKLYLLGSFEANFSTILTLKCPLPSSHQAANTMTSYCARKWCERIKELS